MGKGCYGDGLSDATKDLIERARALAPLLAQHAAEAETARRPHNAVIEALRTSGLFAMLVPKSYGGAGLDLPEFLEVGLALAEGDASMAWVACFYIEHNWILCQFPESFQRRLYTDRNFVLAPAALAPDGVATPCDGGYRLNGRWRWGTGSAHAEWVICGARLEQVSGPPGLHFLALPASDVQIEDTWFSSGMCATASHDILVVDQFVPADQTLSIVDLAEGRASGAALHPEFLYATPMAPILGLAAAMPAVGQTRAALNRLTATLRKGLEAGEAKGNRPAVQSLLGHAEIGIEQCEGLLRSVVDEVCAFRSRASLRQRAGWLARTAAAVDQAGDLLRGLARISGASAQLRSNPLQRSLRDIQTLSTHMVFDLEPRNESLGRTLLGLEPSGFY